jgi:hypothetical protein
MPLLTHRHEYHNDVSQANDETAQFPPGPLVAREGSELARALRAGGWQARAGWRAAAAPGDPPAWYLRFDPPTSDAGDECPAHPH